MIGLLKGLSEIVPIFENVLARSNTLSVYPDSL